jgi:linear primary-alkylsulfatase
VVFADPSNKQARELAADAFEQMGYAAENAPTRSSYLLAAQKLRSDKLDAQRPTPAVNPQVLHVMSAGEVFDYLGTRIDGPRASNSKLVINWRFTDTNETLVSTLENGALTWIAGKSVPNAGASVVTTRAAFEPVILGQRTLADAMDKGAISITGNASVLSELWKLIVDFKTGIPLVTPQ